MVTHAAPYVTVTPVRSYDDVLLSWDWHDYLLNTRTPGALVDVGFCIRPPRALARLFGRGHLPPAFALARPPASQPRGNSVWRFLPSQ